MKNNNTSSIPYGPKRQNWLEQVPEFANGEITPPTASPNNIYGARNFDSETSSRLFDSSLLGITPQGMSDEERTISLQYIQNYSDIQHDNFLGYQASKKLNYKASLGSFLDIFLNNVGDPFVDGNYTLNTKYIERVVLDYYASLWNAKWPSQGPYRDSEGKFVKGDPESYWGYILSMGCSEGNLNALINARDYLSGKMLLSAEIESECEDGSIVRDSSLIEHFPEPTEDKPNSLTPVAFYSEDTHYSIVKAMGVGKIDTFFHLGSSLFPNDCPIADEWPQHVPSTSGTEDLPAGSGAIDVDKLITLIEFFAKKGYPILLVLNYGTTFKGAYDNIPEITKRLEPILKENGLWERKVYQDSQKKGEFEYRTGYWIHIDGALGASYMPFVKMAANIDRYQAFFKANDFYTGPDFDFRNPMIHSIVTSGHKWPGSPWPTGIFMTRQKYMVSPPDCPEYIGSPDTTLAGSRNGLSALILWEHFAKTNYKEQVSKAMAAQETVLYAYNLLKTVSDELKRRDGIDLWLQNTPLSLSLIFRRPSDEIIFKYSLCCETQPSPGEEGELGGKRTYVHFFCMQGVERSLILELAKDLLSDGAFPEQHTGPRKNITTISSVPTSFIKQHKLTSKENSLC